MPVLAVASACATSTRMRYSAATRVGMEELSAVTSCKRRGPKPATQAFALDCGKRGVRCEV